MAVRGWRSAYVLLMYLSPVGHCGHVGAAAVAQPTQEEVLRQIGQNVGSTVDIENGFRTSFAGIAFTILVVLYNYRQQRQVTPRTLNHPGKLLKEICNSIELKPQELKQLKILAEDQNWRTR